MSMTLGEAESILRREAEKVTRLHEAAETVLRAERQSGELVRRHEDLSVQVKERQAELDDLNNLLDQRKKSNQDKLNQMDQDFAVEQAEKQAELDIKRDALKQEERHLLDEEEELIDRRKAVKTELSALELQASKRQQELDEQYSKAGAAKEAELAGLDQAITEAKAVIRALQGSLPSV